jgi:hypothetical protein
MRAQRVVERRGEHRDPVLATFSCPHDQFTALERQILHPQPDRFHQPQPAAVEEARHEPRGTLQLRKERTDLRPAQHDRQPAVRRRASDIEPRQLDVENVAVEEEERL